MGHLGTRWLLARQTTWEGLRRPRGGGDTQGHTGFETRTWLPPREAGPRRSPRPHPPTCSPSPTFHLCSVLGRAATLQTHGRDITYMPGLRGDAVGDGSQTACHGVGPELRAPALPGEASEGHPPAARRPPCRAAMGSGPAGELEG